MAYTSGIFYINFASGSDAARTALTTCTASNPSGSTTRINKTAHGLVTGAIVDLTLFTAWLNSGWKITVVDADNFDLDAATWQATADASGTVTPRGGSSWTDAWLTTTSGATAARIQAGDYIRCAKTADPVSLGQNATWTGNSQTVTLTTAVTKKIEDAISGWTAATNVTAGTNASRKLGATSLQLTPAAGFAGGKMAYKAIAGGGTQDFSAYTRVGLWFRPNTAVGFAANDLRVCLCSDTTGDTIVNALNFPATSASTGWVCLDLDYGGALSASIQSVAIYSTVDPGTTVITFNNIFASNDSSISLKTLIGKTGDVNYNIQSIDGTTIKIDSNNTSATGRGYSGATSTEALYYQVPIYSNVTGNLNTINEAGSKSVAINTLSGGWNTSSGLVDGHTCFANNIVGVGNAFSLQTIWRFENFKFARFASIGTTNVNFIELDNMIFCDGSTVVSATAVTGYIFNNCKFLNISNNSVSITGGGNRISNSTFSNNIGFGIVVGGGIELISCTFSNNASGAVSASSASSPFGTGAILMRNCTVSDSSEVTTSTHYPIVYSFDHDNTQGNHWIFHSAATINWQTTTKQGSDPGSWKTNITSSARNTYHPIIFKIAEVACADSALVTVKAWVKKDHASNIAASIYVEDALYNITGVVAAETTKASDTSWEELTLTFTPTEAGVVPIFAKTWYVAGSSNSYVGSITITQA